MEMEMKIMGITLYLIRAGPVQSYLARVYQIKLLLKTKDSRKGYKERNYYYENYY